LLFKELKLLLFCFFIIFFIFASYLAIPSVN
jgi:hypothetical protein